MPYQPPTQPWADGAAGGTPVLAADCNRWEANQEAAALVAINTQQSAAYTLVLADAGRAVHTTSVTTVAVTVPPASAAAFPVGTVVLLAQAGAGQVTLTAGAGVTLRTASSLTTRAQWSEVSIRKIAAPDEWLAAGDLT